MKTVLIIDDEIEFCQMLSILLTKRKYEVYTAQNLDSGLKKLREIRPDALVLDNNLPDGFGWVYTDEILMNFPGIKIILISAQPLSRYFSGKIGPYLHFLQKPVSFDDIQKSL